MQQRSPDGRGRSPSLTELFIWAALCFTTEYEGVKRTWYTGFCHHTSSLGRIPLIRGVETVVQKPYFANIKIGNNIILVCSLEFRKKLEHNRFYELLKRKFSLWFPRLVIMNSVYAQVIFNWLTRIILSYLH